MCVSNVVQLNFFWKWPWTLLPTIYFLIGEITNFGYRAPRVEFLGLKVRQNCGNLSYIISFYDALLYLGVPECYRAIIGRLHTHWSSQSNINMPGPTAATTVFIIGVLNSCSWLSVEQEPEQEKDTRVKRW